MPRKPPAALSDRQKAILEVLCGACARAGTDELEYASEWLGYLPFGAYHWVDVEGRRGVEQRFPDGWEAKDIDKLATAGMLEEIGRVEGGFDPDDVHVRYRITPAGWALVGRKGPRKVKRKRPRKREREAAPATPRAAVAPVDDEAARKPHEDFPRPVDPGAGPVGAPGEGGGFRYCSHCDQWFDVALEPEKWSVGMCLSCSMDRSSELAERD